MTGGRTTQTVYLSRLLLDPRSRQVRSELAQPYEMHRTLMHAFEQHLPSGTPNPREMAGMLFRADSDERNRRIIVYVQSIVEPDWSFLADCRDYLASDTSEANPAYKNVAASYEKLRDGQVLAFRLRANPTKRIGKGSGVKPELKGKRVGLLREEDQVAWLVRKGQEREVGKPGGFELVTQRTMPSESEAQDIPQVRVRQEGKFGGRKRENGKSYTTTHLAVLVDGHLQITDADAFRQTLVRGIGSAKAYGFGLLSIAPDRSP